MNPVIIKEVEQTIKIGYSGKALGNTNPKFSPDANENFARFLSYFPELDVCDMYAVGEDTILNVDNLNAQEASSTKADCLITTKANKLLVLKAADCIPVVYFVPGENKLALAHLGTSGAALHLSAKVITEFGQDPGKIHCYIGPHISKDSYIFPNKDITNKNLDKTWEPYITDENDGLHIDLLGYVLDELKSSGVKKENITVEQVDTGSDANYYSHRRHRITGEEPGRNCFAACLL